MQMVEDVKKHLLRFLFSSKLMNVVDNQKIDHLVEVQKVVRRVAFYGIDKLGLELIGINVKNNFFGIFLFYFNTDGLSQMGFTQARIAINE